jgi:hypothetical protein
LIIDICSYETFSCLIKVIYSKNIRASTLF